MKIPALLFALCAAAVGQEAPDASPRTEDSYRQIRCELLIVRLTTAKALGLHKQLRDPEKIGQGMEKLLAMIAQDQAELVDWPCVTTKSGNRAVIENIRELRYPTVYKTPKILSVKASSPEGVLVPTPTAPPSDPAPSPTDNTAAKPGSTEESPKPSQQLSAASPTNFSIQNVGVSFEIEPTIGPDGATVDMNLSPRHTSLLGYRRETFEAKGQYTVAVEQPIFGKQVVQTNITLKSGQSQLMGFYRLQEPKNIVELHILTVTILETKYKILPQKPRPPERPIDPGLPPQAQ